MSDTTSAPAWGVRVTFGVVLALLLAAAFALAPKASADFTTGKCAGVNITGEGGSFAKDAQIKFNDNFKTNYCIGTPGFGSINVTYSPEGSGAGITAMTNRTLVPRFGGTDDPPTPAQVAAMNAGTVSESDNGKLHVFPIAVGSVVALVNFPDGCNPEKLTAEHRTISAAEITATPAKKALLRVRFPKALFEKVWAGESNAKWTEAFPELDAVAACEVPITRVVRFDQSGTTFTLKDYLNTIAPAKGWKSTYSTVGPVLTRQWPNAEFGSGGQCTTTEAPGKQADSIDHLTSGCAKGNGQLIAKLVATDGSIGYADLATARNSTPTLAVDPTKTEAPTTPYWTQVQNGAGVFTEPTADETNGYKTAAGSPTKGSNCLNATYTGIPTDSFGNWENASGVNSAAGWGICTLTYALVFDDNATVWGNNPEEEAKAKTVKDYQESIVSDAAQAQLFGADYAPLPASFLAISKKAVAAIGWNKSSSKEEEKVTPPPVVTPKTDPPPVAVSNAFSVLRKTISSSKGTASIQVKLPGAGKLDLLAKAKVGKAQVKVGHVVLTAGGAGTYTLTLKPSGAAKTALQDKGKLATSLKFTFSPTGGTPKTSNSSVTLKLVQKKGGK
jgi:ABC-type phosphate transport system substrate-binding protein